MEISLLGPRTFFSMLKPLKTALKLSVRIHWVADLRHGPSILRQGRKEAERMDT